MKCEMITNWKVGEDGEPLADIECGRAAVEIVNGIPTCASCIEDLEREQLIDTRREATRD